MARRKRKQYKFVEHVHLTKSIAVAFGAAVALGRDPWDSPKGSAIVVKVYPQIGHQWVIVYRLIKHWGKEAWL